NEYFLESLEGMTTLKLMNRDREHAENIRTRSFNYYYMIVKTMRISFYSTILTQAFIYGGMLWSTLILIRSCSAGTITMAAAFYALMLAYNFFAPVKDLINTGHTAMNGVAAASNIFSFLDLDPSAVPVDTSREKCSDENGLVITNAHFGYTPDREVIRGVDMRFEKGKTTALVGASGCGKSTMVNLMMHFNDLSEGNIYLEGTDICAVSHDELRKRISLVPQSTYIFSGNVRDNLKIVDPSLTDEEMLRVMKIVKLDALIDKDGLDTDVGEGGARLSGGQRQKIGIARALLADTEYMIFDEATSNVDASSEDDIWDTIQSLSGVKTLIIISHRLSTVRHADRIYVMKNGAVAEEGTHDALMKLDGIYAGLVREQNILENYGRRDER
nr:ATP-binding cassette domain-containing protein [Eubacteriales bacterium]